MYKRQEYYTGVVFRGYLPGVGQPVLSGGRYDRLLNDFGLLKPAIGFAIQLDAVAGYLQQTQPQRPTPPAALVYWTQEQSARGFAFLKQLRKQGLFCESSLAESREEAEAYALSLIHILFIRQCHHLELDGLSQLFCHLDFVHYSLTPKSASTCDCSAATCASSCSSRLGSGWGKAAFSASFSSLVASRMVLPSSM